MVKEFKVNPDGEFVKALRRAIKDNNGYCPCAIEKSKDTKCPCKDFRECGDCQCGLYVKTEDDE